MDEPELNINNIQGNIIPGFNKDYQAFLFLKIEDKHNFESWLKKLVPRVTTMGQVLAYRSLLTEEERHGQPPKVKTTWINIAFSYDALEKRLGVCKSGDFKDQAFTDGLSKRSKGLGDPKGNPEKWVVGGLKNEPADIILIVASDDRLDLFNEVAGIGKTIYEPTGQSGVKVIFTQYGANLPGKREHFGFRDGISQPGVRGQISGNSGGYLTPRYEGGNQGNPGLDLVWPGEFVFGAKYFKQRPDDATKSGFPSLIAGAAPVWAEDGSFLVFRRLKQNVGAFHTFLKVNTPKDKDPGLLGAKCVGRWASGAPILRAPQKDNAKWAEDASKNNDFMFTEDPTGKDCPFAAHIRKVYPRDGVNDNEMQTHRLLRRGIPYGEPSLSSPTAPVPDKDGDDRGLLFLAYQTSIEDQFEFLQREANNTKDKPGGHDPIIGQSTQEGTRKRQFTITLEDTPKTVDIEEEWVTPTGGGYFFAPSIEALYMLASPLRRGSIPDKAPSAIPPEDWARIWAHAWLEQETDGGKFKDMLRKNPAKALEEFREKAKKAKFSSEEFPSVNDCEKLFDLAGDIYKRPFDRGSFKRMSFSGMSANDLKEIAEKGTLHSKPFCVQPSEWIIVRAKK